MFAPIGATADTYWQCVPFARLISGIQIFGDAHTWWRQAVGKYETGIIPRAGAVLCFKPTSRMRLGHVAVVSQVLTDRVVQITHANWSPIEGSRGKVEKDVTAEEINNAFRKAAGGALEVGAKEISTNINSFQRNLGIPDRVSGECGDFEMVATEAGGLPEERAATADIWQGRVLVFHNGRFDWI